MTLSEFLLARIAEDERTARSLDEFVELDFGVRHAIAQCEARRRIVEKADMEPSDSGDGGFPDGWYAMGVEMLQLLALPYADHPAYREEWRP